MISPLLANVYINRVLRHWRETGMSQRLGGIVSYADDFVILCRSHRQARRSLEVITAWLTKVGLTIHPDKTRVCNAWEESFDFLGYTIGRCYSPKTGKAYIGTRPSRKKITRLCREISEMTSRRWTLLPVEDRVARLNRKLLGWSNYFCLGPVSKAYAAVDSHVCRRLRQWLCAKHKVPGQGTSRFPDDYLHQTLGLVKLPERTRSFSWVNS